MYLRGGDTAALLRVAVPGNSRGNTLARLLQQRTHLPRLVGVGMHPPARADRVAQEEALRQVHRAREQHQGWVQRRREHACIRWLGAVH